MSDLRTPAQQALEALEKYRQMMFAEAGCRWGAGDAAITALRAALAQEQAEPVQEPDLSRCPQCNGPADNGHDRSIPPNPYLCTRCMAEPVQEPVAKVELMMTGGNAGLATRIVEIDDHLRDRLRDRLRPGQLLYTAPPPAPVAQQEPVAWVYEDTLPLDYPYDVMWPHSAVRDGVRMFPVFAPPQREPLTEEEIDAATAQERDALLDHIYEYGTAAEGVLERIRKLCRAVERAHGIKE